VRRSHHVGGFDYSGEAETDSIKRVMVTPIWFDRGRGPRPMRRCWRCGSEQPIVELRTDDFRRLGWSLPATQTISNWCGHSTEYVPWPIGPQRWRLIPVWTPEPPANPLERFTVPEPPGAEPSRKELPVVQ
jgi:hypothetical protein